MPAERLLAPDPPAASWGCRCCRCSRRRRSLLKASHLPPLPLSRCLSMFARAARLLRLFGGMDLKTLPTLDLRNKPMLLPAAAFAAGTLLAFQASYLPVLLLALLALAGLALGRRTGVCLAFLAFGLLTAAVRLGLPGDPLAALPPRPPGGGGPRRWPGTGLPDDEGWSAPARVVRLRQGDLLLSPALEVNLHLPDPEELPPPFGTTLRAKGYLARSPGYRQPAPVAAGPLAAAGQEPGRCMEMESPPGAAGAPLGGAPGAGGGGVPRRRGGERRRGRRWPGRWCWATSRGCRSPGCAGCGWPGIYHLMSVSGVHVALVAGLVWLLGFWLPRPLRLLLMLAVDPPLPAAGGAAAGPAALGGDGGPRRAGAARRAPAGRRQRPGLGGDPAAARPPDLALSPGFQLTVSATAGLLLLAPALARRWQGRRLPARLTEAAAASVGAHLATLPWALPRFHMLSPLAPLLNLPAPCPGPGLALIASLAVDGRGAGLPRRSPRACSRRSICWRRPFSWPSRTPPGGLAAVPLALSAGTALADRGSESPGCSSCRAAGTASASPSGSPSLAILGVVGRPWLAITSPETPRSRARDARRGPGGRHPAARRRPRPAGGRRRLARRRHRRPGAPAGAAGRGGGSPRGARDDPSRSRPLRRTGGHRRLPPRARGLDGPGLGPRRLRRHPAGAARSADALPLAGEGDHLRPLALTALHPEADDHHPVNERSLVLLAEVHGRRALLTGDVESWAEHDLARCCAAELGPTSSRSPTTAAAPPRPRASSTPWRPAWR